MKHDLFDVDSFGVVIHALVLSEPLETVLGVDERPESWLLAYRENQRVIDCAASITYREAPRHLIIVDAGRLRNGARESC